MIRFYTGSRDCRWLRETALADYEDIPYFQSFALEGNEDCPTAIILYADADPVYSDTVTRYELQGDFYTMVSREMR